MHASAKKLLLAVTVFLLFLAAGRMPLVFAQGEDVTKTVTDLIYMIIGACYAIMIPIILVGIMMGYVQIAGPWGLQTVKKSGRGQLEIGFITLFLFLITPAILAFIVYVGTSLGGSWDKWIHPQT
jgi:hypothetical protein